MNAIEEALRHVQMHHPEVTQVFYGRDAIWYYCSDTFEAPKFGAEIDIGLLENAQAEVSTFPFAYTNKRD